MSIRHRGVQARRFFGRLGALVEERWRAKNFDSSFFASIALGALEEMPPAQKVDKSQLVEWVLSGEHLPAQYPEGEPPLTLYRHSLFKIGAFYWLDDEHTPIHQHCVSGALHLLAGASLHCLHRFEITDRVNGRLLIGDLRLESIECLMEGDSRPIENGDRTIHATFHLTRPTVTIVIQTHLDPETLPQYSYWKPALAYDPTARNPLAKRQLELLENLHAAGDRNYSGYLARRVAQPDFEEAFHALKQGFTRLPHKDFLPLLELARKEHGSRVDVLLPTFREMRRVENLTARNRLMRKPEHNFLLGLLLHLPDRASILRCTRWHFGGDPVARILMWIGEMARIKINGSTEPNILGVHFDEPSLVVFECLLRGISFSGLKKRLTQEYDRDSVVAQEETLKELWAAFKNSSLFHPLFATQTTAPRVRIKGPKLRPSAGKIELARG